MLWEVATDYMDQYGSVWYIWIRKKCSDSMRCSKNPSMKGAVIYFWALVYSKQNPHLLSKLISSGFIPPKLSTCNQMGSTILFHLIPMSSHRLDVFAHQLHHARFYHIIGPWISYGFV